MTLKDIKVSKNPIPVQPALWLRPMGGLSFKIYYPQGGNWVEVMTKSTPASEQPETPASEAPATQIDEETLQNLEQSIETLRQAINTLQNTVTNTSKSVEAASINGQSTIQTLLQDEGILVLPAFPLTFKEVHEANLPNYNLTGELMDALFSRKYSTVKILGSKASANLYNGDYRLTNSGNAVTLVGVFDSIATVNGKTEVRIRIKRESVSGTALGLFVNDKPSAAYTYTVTVSTKNVSVVTPGPGGPVSPGGGTAEPVPSGGGSLDPGAGPSSGSFNGGSGILP